MNSVFKSLIFISTLVSYSLTFGQVLNVTAFRDTNLPRIEINPSHYEFVFPVEKDFYDSASFTPPTDGRFLVQNYGPRTIGNYDNHQGSDIWGHTIKNGILSYNPPAVCMCDGLITGIEDGPDSIMDLSTSGRTIYYACDSFSKVFNSQITIVYRHLDSIKSTLLVGDYISKGDTLAFVGSSGTTSLSHLHFDFKSIPNEWGNTTTAKYLNPNRLFDPTEHPHILGKFDNAHIEILHDWADSTLIRIHWPHNQHINRFEFTNGSYNIIYDVEEVRASYPVFEPSIWARDSMKIFPYRTNGYRTALYYQLNDTLPSIFPNSPHRDTNIMIYGYSHIPLSADSVVNVYDFVLEHVPNTHLTNDWIIKLTDVWGYTVQGQFSGVNTQNMEGLAPKLKIYPNPVSNFLIIDLDKKNELSIVKIYDIYGQTAIAERITENKINVSKLNSGIYFISLNGLTAGFIKN
mgnify:FL=1